MHCMYTNTGTLPMVIWSAPEYESYSNCDTWQPVPVLHFSNRHLKGRQLVIMTTPQQAMLSIVKAMPKCVVTDLGKLLEGVITAQQLAEWRDQGTVPVPSPVEESAPAQEPRYMFNMLK